MVEKRTEGDLEAKGQIEKERVLGLGKKKSALPGSEPNAHRKSLRGNQLRHPSPEHSQSHSDFTVMICYWRGSDPVLSHPQGISSPLSAWESSPAIVTLPSWLQLPLDKPFHGPGSFLP